MTEFLQSFLVVLVILTSIYNSGSARVYLKPIEDIEFRTLLNIGKLANDLYKTPVQDSSDNVKTNEILKIDEHSSKINTPNDETESEEDLSIEGLNLNDGQKNILRKRWRSSCDRKASKSCRKACINTYKIVCGSFDCRRKMKSDFKRECRRNCKSYFVSKYSSETDSS